MNKSVRLEFEGADELMKALASMPAEVEQEVKDAVNASGLAIVGDIKKQMLRSAPTGRVYKKTKPKRAHRASAPGQPPAVDTGRLVNSITFKELSGAKAEVFTNVEYGPWLEFGTANIEARPAWLPAVERAKVDFVKRVSEALRKGMA